MSTHPVRAALAAIVVGAFLLVSGHAVSAQAEDLNCDDFDFQEDAQAVFDQNPDDPFGLDGPIGPTSSGVPGLACERLPSREETEEVTEEVTEEPTATETETEAPATTAPATTVPATTAPATTMPATTVPATTAPAATDGGTTPAPEAPPAAPVVDDADFTG